MSKNKSCTLHPKCRNKNNQVVESKLFEDLLSIAKNSGMQDPRGYAVKHYNRAISGEIKDTLRYKRYAKTGKLQFDDNGELSVTTYLSLVKEDVQETALMEAIKKNHLKHTEGNNEYTDALQEVANFNKVSPYRDKYLATLEYAEEWGVTVNLVENTKANREKLYNLVQAFSLKEKVLYRLNELGVSVNFIVNGDSKYSLENVEKSANGLYSLVEISSAFYEDNAAEVMKYAAQIAFDCVYNDTIKTPLAERLYNAVTVEVIKDYVEKNREKFPDVDIDSIDEDNESLKMDVIYDMIEKALYSTEYENADTKRSPIKNLLNRFVNYIKSIFSKTSPNTIRKDIEDAKISAAYIVNTFMQGESEGDARKMFAAEERPPINTNAQVYRQVAVELRKLAEQLRVIAGEKTYNRITKELDIIEAKTPENSVSPTIMNDMYNDALVSIVQYLSFSLSTTVPELMEKLKYTKGVSFTETLTTNAKALRVLTEHTKTINTLNKIITESLTSIEGQPRKLQGEYWRIEHINLDGSKETVDLSKVLQDLTTSLEGPNGLNSKLLLKKKELFCYFLKEIYGRDYVEHADQIVFDKFFKIRKADYGKEGATGKEGNRRMHISDIVEALDNDISIAERFLFSMSNNSDIVGQIVDRAVKLHNHAADTMATQTMDQLKMLKLWAEKHGIKDTTIFCETEDILDEKGNVVGSKLTGNIIDEVDWAKYERDYKEFRAKCLAEFKETYGLLTDKSEFQKALLWDEFYHPKLKEWRKENKIYWNGAYECFRPNLLKNPKYRNPKYDELMKDPNNREFLQRFREIKRTTDNFLPKGSMPYYRMPQFKATFIEKVRNKRNFENGICATFHSAWSWIVEHFGTSSEDYMYGSEQTYNSDDEEIFHNELQSIKENTNRLPLFGINKIKDTSELSTDFYHSLYAFSGMAAKHKVMSEVVDILEVGKDVLIERKVGVTKFAVATRATVNTVKNTFSKKVVDEADVPRAYARYIKYLDKQLYSNNVSKTKVGKVVVKFAQNLTALASYMFLGGNLAGGAVNTTTGVIEMFKEQTSGEFFDSTDIAVANRQYFGALAKSFIGVKRLGENMGEDDVEMFLRYFNFRNDSALREKSWATTTNKLVGQALDSLWFLPYSMGDHYMQGVPYLAQANHYKLYDANGKLCTLKDAYGISLMEDGKTKTYGIKGLYFKTLKDRKEYYKLLELKKLYDEKVEDAGGSSRALFVTFTDEETEKLNNFGIYITKDNKDRLGEIISKRLDDFTFNMYDESAFMDKCREVNTRMHGIYNSLDKPAFSQEWYGNALLAMKGYALGYLEGNFSGNKFNIALDTQGNPVTHESEGKWITWAKWLLSLTQGNGGFKSLNYLWMYSKKSEDLLKAYGFSDSQYRNLRRMETHQLILAILAFLKFFVLFPPEEEPKTEGEMKKKALKDSKKSKLIKGVDYVRGEVQDGEYTYSEKLGYYFVTRLYQEQAAYMLPVGMAQEARSLFSMDPIASSSLSTLRTFAVHLVTQDEFSQNKKKSSLDWNDPSIDKSNPDNYIYVNPNAKMFEGVDVGNKGKKWRNDLWKITPYWKTWRVLEDPVGAAQSYEFMRNIKR